MYIIRDHEKEYHEFREASEKDEFLGSLSEDELLKVKLFDVVREKTFQVQRRIVPVVSRVEK